MNLGLGVFPFELSPRDMNIAFEINQSFDEPIYKQLAQALEEAIESGRLRPGDYVPTTREMAANLQIARVTVVKAYRELLTRGYLTGKPGDGTVVSDNPPQARDAKAASGEDHVPIKISAEPNLSHLGERLTRMEIPQNTSFDLPGMNHGCSAREFLPINRWRELTSRYCRPGDSDKLEFVTDPFGHMPLREAISRYLARTKGVICQADQVLTFPSTQRVCDFVISLLINAGDTVAVEDPGYAGIRINAIAHGARLHPVPVDQDGLITSRLPSADQSCKLLHTTPDCQDPSGSTMSMARKIELAEWARRTGAFLLEDAWDSDYRYGGPVSPSLQSYCPEKVLYLYTPFKVLYPLTMIGFLIVPRALIPAFTKLKLITERHMPSLDALVLTDFISEGHFDKHIDGVLKVYRHRRQSLILALKTSFREQITIFPKTAGLHLRFQLSVQAADSEVIALANRLAIPLVNTTQYYFGAGPRGEFLMQFTLETPEKMIPKIAEFAELLSME
jgi:GntR family transcriptional regulator / MocR family aminotransferase